MKKLIFTFVAIFLSLNIFSQPITESHKKFIRGNLSEKTSAVRESSGSDGGKLAEVALDFVIENRPLLANDRDLSPLAVAAVLALPKDCLSDKAQNSRIASKMMNVFYLFNDENVRISVLDKLPVFYDESDNSLVNGINEYLKTSNNSSNISSLKAAITCIGKIGNSDSFNILYDGWKNQRWQKANTETEKALILLSQKSIVDVATVILRSNVAENYKFLKFLTEFDEINKNFISEVAENTLSQAIYNRENNAELSKNEIEYQLLSLKIITDNKWTRASNLVVRFFAIARQEYESGLLNSEQFIQVINCTASSQSIDAARSLSEFLALMNRNMEQNKSPEKNVVLAVIKNLGALGDKTSFDNLLYVTYLSYPEEVIAASRDALSKLRW